ncbi:MAG: hypothetical protein DRO88_09460 [Promethearchaeia archaeon]|nr:MAG: hypothetical protein DRO88_09460 [Candidatus Lokiarchaeia archaeon]
MKTLKIGKHNIPIKKKLIFLQGNYKINQIENLPYLNQEWNNILEDIFINSDLLIKFISNLDNIIMHQNLEEKGTILEYWGKIYGSFEGIKEIILYYKKINNLNTLILNKTNLVKEIEYLELVKRKIQVSNKKSIFQTKKDLLSKLINTEQTLSSEFKFQSEEFYSFNQRITNFLDKKAKLDKNLYKLKQEQRNLFSETNQITKQMDEKDPLLETYKNKIKTLDPIKNQEDYNRIKKKLDNIRDLYDDLKKKRSIKIKESKEVKQKIRNLRLELKRNSGELNKLMPKFQEIKKKFEELNVELENIKQQRKTIQTELKSFLELDDKENLNLDSDNEAIIYNNPHQIEEKLKKYRNQMDYIERNIEENFKTQNIDFIRKEIEKDKKKLLENIKLNSEKLDIIAKEINNFKKFFDRIKKIQFWMNKLLSQIGLIFSFSISFEEEKMLLTYNIMRNNQSININSDLKRIEKTYFYLSFIISSYLGGNYNFIPISINNLPKFMITRQNFIKNVKMLDNISDEFPDDITIIFFLEQNTYELPLKVLKID